MKHYWFLAAILMGGCGKVNSGSGDDVQPVSCTVACTADGDCPSGFTCGDLGLCVEGSDTCSCTANEFIACDGENAVSCNATANGVATEACGAAGCNATEGRCNDCAPSTIACSADSTALQDCSADGMVTQSTACPAGCVAGGSGDHCGHIQPAWLPDACDTDATTPVATLSGTLDTTMSANCTGGIVDVNGTMFCIVRASTVNIGDLKVTGTNAIAFVADEALTVTGVLDVSADGATNGPGPAGNFAGGTIIQSSYRGAGGGGFATAGGTGGGHESGTPAGATGGAMSDRLPTDRFFGGSRGGASVCGTSISPCLFNNVDFAGGGAGGGALLIACRGTVSVSGTIDAGGGGGAGGGDHNTTTGTMQYQGGGGGGGSGGFVVFQGTQVSITGNLWANGGGGGGACGTDNCTGPAGSDGQRATTGAPGGDPPGNTGGGGVGASIATTNGAPGNGENTFSSAAAGAGGGGGSMGKFLVFTPAGVTPTLTPAGASPAPVASTTSLVVE